MNDLQPGMLALVTNTINAGKVVTVVSSVSAGHKINSWSMYVCDGTPDIWLVAGEDLYAMLNGVEVVKPFTYMRGKHLLPLPPLADPISQKQQQELHA